MVFCSMAKDQVNTKQRGHVPLVLVYEEQHMPLTPDTLATRTVGQPNTQDGIPPYAPMLAAYHRAHALELRTIIADLPLHANDNVLDMACGDGTYTRLLAERVAPYGTITGVDISPAYLQIAQAHAHHAQECERIRFQQGDIARLPFADNSFDLVWCAQSLYTLPDPMSALGELRRVTRAGGTVAIFENDLLHHLILPWPVDLELALRQAQLESLQQEADGPAKFYVGRNLATIFAEARLKECVITPYSSSRAAPLSDDERLFLNAYLDDLIRRAQPYLTFDHYQQIRTMLDPNLPSYLLDQPTFNVTHLNFVACGRKP